MYSLVDERVAGEFAEIHERKLVLVRLQHVREQLAIAADSAAEIAHLVFQEPHALLHRDREQRIIANGANDLIRGDLAHLVLLFDQCEHEVEQRLVDAHFEADQRLLVLRGSGSGTIVEDVLLEHVQHALALRGRDEHDAIVVDDGTQEGAKGENDGVAANEQVWRRFTEGGHACGETTNVSLCRVRDEVSPIDILVVAGVAVAVAIVERDVEQVLWSCVVSLAREFMSSSSLCAALSVVSRFQCLSHHTTRSHNSHEKSCDTCDTCDIWHHVTCDTAHSVRAISNLLAAIIGKSESGSHMKRRLFVKSIFLGDEIDLSRLKPRETRRNQKP